MSTNDHHSEYGFFVRIGLHGSLSREHAQDPTVAIRSLLHKGVSLHDKVRAWVWRASPMRPDLYDATRPVRVGAFGPVGDPLVFDVGLELLELRAPSDDPEAILEKMLEESEETDLPTYPRAPNISSCQYDAVRHVFLVTFENQRTEALPGSYVRRTDGTPVPPGVVRGCAVAQYGFYVLVELADGSHSQTSFSGAEVLYEMDPDFRARWDAVSKGADEDHRVVCPRPNWMSGYASASGIAQQGPGAVAFGRTPGTASQVTLSASVVHVLGPRGRMLCGKGSVTEPGDWNEEDSWCPLEDWRKRASCGACCDAAGRGHAQQGPGAVGFGRAPGTASQVTDSAQPDTSSEEERGCNDDLGHRGRGTRIDAEGRHALDVSDTRLRDLARVTIEAIWDALEDLEAVPAGLHPVDVVQKYLQRGNIRKDGQW